MTADPPTIDTIAAEWAVRLGKDPLSADAHRELDEWLSADTRHRGALVRARAAWLDLDRLAALSAQSNRFATSSSPRDASRPETTAREGLPSPNRRFLLAAGFSAVAVTGAGLSAWQFLKRRGEVYENAVGEIRRVTLPDRSTMLLDSATKAEVCFSDSSREIELVRGQGLFEVTKDSARPFVVHARGVSVRAVGTAFSVRAVDQDVAVTVTEGVVEVADTTSEGSGTPEWVSAAERAVVSESKGVRVERITLTQVERHLAWRDGRLAFDGESLAEAVREVNRHNTHQIHIDDPALAERSVVGIFHASDAEGFAQTVAAALGAQSVTDGDTIHLTAHEPLRTPQSSR